MAPYAVKGGIVRTADAVERASMLKGVDTSLRLVGFFRGVARRTANLPRVGDSIRTKDIAAFAQRWPTG